MKIYEYHRTYEYNGYVLCMERFEEEDCVKNWYEIGVRKGDDIELTQVVDWAGSYDPFHTVASVFMSKVDEGLL